MSHAQTPSQSALWQHKHKQLLLLRRRLDLCLTNTRRHSSTTSGQRTKSLWIWPYARKLGGKCRSKANDVVWPVGLILGYFTRTTSACTCLLKTMWPLLRRLFVWDTVTPHRLNDLQKAKVQMSAVTTLLLTSIKERRSGFCQISRMEGLWATCWETEGN